MAKKWDPEAQRRALVSRLLRGCREFGYPDLTEESVDKALGMYERDEIVPGECGNVIALLVKSIMDEAKETQRMMRR